MAITKRGVVSGYKGQTYAVPAMRGGWNTNTNVDLIPPESMVEALNINLHRGGRETRGGVDKVNGTPIAGSPRIMGVFQFRKKNGNTFIVTATADGKIQKDYTTVLKSGLATNRVTTFEVFNDTLYICNGSDIPQLWDGVAASTSDLAAGKRPTDWSGTNHPVMVKKHGRGVSEALWAFGVASQKQRIYASATGTDNFSDAQVTTINIETGDGFGIVGMEEFGNRLIPIGKRRAYLIEDSDPSRANWGYSAAQWEGGVGGLRLLTKTPNDLIAMAEDGEIYSVVTTQNVGDYRAVSLTRPAHIHAWIADNVALSAIDDFHMIYDPVLRALKIFVLLVGQNTIDTALVFFIDRPPEEAWVRHQYFAPSIASSSALIREGAGDWRVYTGGHAGTVYALESVTALDDGIAFTNGFTTPERTFGDPRSLKRYDLGWLVMRPQGAEQMKVGLFVDGKAVGSGFLLVDELGNPVIDENGNMIEGLHQEFFFVKPEPGNRLVNASYPLGLIGTRLQADFVNNVGGEKFFVSQELYDFLPLGPAPQ